MAWTRWIGSTVGDLRGRALWVVVGALVCQVGLGFSYTVNPLARDIIAELGWTRAEFSAATAPQLWMISLASVGLGPLVLRFGGRRVLIAAALLLSVVCLALSRVQDWWQMVFVTLLMGVVVVGVGDITAGQIVAQWIRRSRGLALGIVYTGSNLGGFLLVPYAVGVAEMEGQSWRDAFVHLSLLALVLVLPAALWLVRERRSEAEVISEDLVAEGVDDLDVRAALRTRSFWILWATLFSFFFFFLAILDHLVLFLTDRGMDRADAAYFYKTALGLGVVSKVLLGLLADRIPHRAAIVLDYALLAVSSLLLLLLPDDRWIWLFVVCFGFATAARDVVYPLMIIHCFGAKHLAPIYGAIMLGMAPGGSLGKIFAGAVHDRLGSYTVAFACFAVVNLLAVLALAGLRDERQAARTR